MSLLEVTKCYYFLNEPCTPNEQNQRRFQKPQNKRTRRSRRNALQTYTSVGRTALFAVNFGWS